MEARVTMRVEYENVVTLDLEFRKGQSPGQQDLRQRRFVAPPILRAHDAVRSHAMVGLEKPSV